MLLAENELVTNFALHFCELCPVSTQNCADTLHQSSLTDACYMLSAARCNAALVSGSQHVCSITSSVSHYSVLVYADSNTRLIDLLLPLY